MAKKKSEDGGAVSEFVTMKGPAGTSQIGIPVGDSDDEVAVYKADPETGLFLVHRDHAGHAGAHGFVAVVEE